MQHDRPTLPGQIAEPALVMAVDAFRGLGAGRALHRSRSWAVQNGYLVGTGQDLVDHQARRDQRQDAFGQRRLSMEDGDSLSEHSAQNSEQAARKARENLLI